jgi:hypothetical protein
MGAPFSLSPVESKPPIFRDRKIKVERDTLQHILSKKKCDIPKDCVVDTRELVDGKRVLVRRSKCKFRLDCMKYYNSLKHHDTREAEG